MVSIMATILVLSSSGKEFNSCGSIFFFQSLMMFLSYRLCQKWREVKKEVSEEKDQKRWNLFFFPPSSFFTLFFISPHTREKKYRSRAGYTHMFPLPSMDAHQQHHHHYRPQGHQSTSDSEEMAFMASQLLDGIFFFFLDSLFFSLFLSAYFHFRSTTKR